MKRLILFLLTAMGLFAQVDEFQLLISRGVALDHYGDYPGAIKVFREALDLIDRKKLGDWARATTLNSMAMAYDELGEPSEAIHLYRRSLTIIERTRGKNTLDYATVLGNLAADYSHTGQASAAEVMLREILAIFAGHEPPDEVRLAITESILAPIVIAKGDLKEGERFLVHSLDILEKNPGNMRQIPAALNNLGVLRRDQKRYPEAIEMFHKTIQVLESEYGPDHPKMMQSLNNLALTYFETGRSAEAGDIMEKAMRIGEKSLRTEHQSYGALLLNYAAYLRKTGRKSEAKQFEQRGRTILSEAARRNGAGQTVDASSFRAR